MSVFLIISGVILRLIPHLPNFTPIGAMGLFCGAKLNKKAFLIILATMAISDYLLLYINPFSEKFIDFTTLYPPTAFIHSTTIFVYGSLLLNILIGKIFMTYTPINRLIGMPFLASVQFFLITNFGVWVTGMYNSGVEGLLQSYIMALPFFKYTILGDFFYTAIFFGTYELAVRITRKYAVQRLDD